MTATKTRLLKMLFPLQSSIMASQKFSLLLASLWHFINNKYFVGMILLFFKYRNLARWLTSFFRHWDIEFCIFIQRLCSIAPKQLCFSSYWLRIRSRYLLTIKKSNRCLSDNLTIMMFHQQSHKGIGTSEVHILDLTKCKKLTNKIIIRIKLTLTSNQPTLDYFVK